MQEVNGSASHLPPSVLTQTRDSDVLIIKLLVGLLFVLVVVGLPLDTYALYRLAVTSFGDYFPFLFVRLPPHSVFRRYRAIKSAEHKYLLTSLFYRLSKGPGSSPFALQFAQVRVSTPSKGSCLTVDNWPFSLPRPGIFIVRISVNHFGQFDRR